MARGDLYEVALILDIPFISWIISRRLPVFALIVALIIFGGNLAISNKSPSYYSSAELQITDDFLTSVTVDTDKKTQIEFLKFRVASDPQMQALRHKWTLLPQQTTVHHDAVNDKLILGIHYPDAEIAKLIADSVTAQYVKAAKQLRNESIARNVSFLEAQVATLKAELAAELKVLDQSARGGNVLIQDDYQRTNTLITNAMEELSRAKALLVAQPEIALRIIRTPETSSVPSGPNQRSMLLALISFAIFCGVVAVLVLEWLDTVIRRPVDIDRHLGLSTFGVIPDLQPQPIKK